MGADGVHLGQTDMPATVARKLLPKDAIIGVSVNSVEEAKIVAQEGIAHYVGIGAIWQTNSKKLTTPILGPRAVGPILDELSSTGIKAVAIGMPFRSSIWLLMHPRRWYQGRQCTQDASRLCWFF